MNDLFLSEWRRFRRLTLIVAVVHAVALLLLSRLTTLLQLGYEDHAVMLVVYMLLGLALAAIQVGSYRRPSQWLWLIHRPLSPARIFGALASSAAAMLTLAVFVPLLAFVIATDVFTTHVVDSRHYVALIHALAFTLMAWLAGAHAAVSRNKATIAILIAPILLAMHLASVWWLLLPVLACLAWLAVIALHAFRADRAAPIARHSVLLLTALPLQLGFFLLVFHLGKAAAEFADLVVAANSSTTVLESDPGAATYIRSLAQQSLIDGLADSGDPRAAGWREQLPLLDVAELMPEIERFPVRDQISNLRTAWVDDRRGVEWTFSHDRMMFHGRDRKTGADRGWWGTAGAGTSAAFAQVPIFGLTRDTLYAIDDETQQQHELIRLPAGEWFVGKPTQALGRMLLLTNRRVLAYRTDPGAAPFTPPALDWQVVLPGGDEPVLVNVAELLDGWLVSLFHYGGNEYDGFEFLLEPWQQVVHIDHAGVATVVGERRDFGDFGITLGGSPAVPQASWWLSPPLYLLGRWPDSALDTGLTQPLRLAPLPTVPAFYPIAAGLMLLSLALAYWWLRGPAVAPGRRRVWLAACGLLGLPAFLSLICLEPRAPR